MIDFIPLNESHIDLMQKWLSSGEALYWYERNAPKTKAELRQKYLIDKPRGGTRGLIVHYQGKPTGHIQYYRVVDYPAWCSLVSGLPHDYGLDLFIGREDLIGKGIGTQVVKAGLEKLIFVNSDAQRCIIGPSPENKRAIRCYEKCGFQYDKTVVAENGEREYIMIAHKPDQCMDLNTKN